MEATLGKKLVEAARRVLDGLGKALELVTRQEKDQRAELKLSILARPGGDDGSPFAEGGGRPGAGSEIEEARQPGELVAGEPDGDPAPS